MHSYLLKFQNEAWSCIIFVFIENNIILNFLNFAPFWSPALLKSKFHIHRLEEFTLLIDRFQFKYTFFPFIIFLVRCFSHILINLIKSLFFETWIKLRKYNKQEKSWNWLWYSPSSLQKDWNILRSKAIYLNSSR